MFIKHLAQEDLHVVSAQKNRRQYNTTSVIILFIILHVK